MEVCALTVPRLQTSKEEGMHIQYRGCQLAKEKHWGNRSRSSAVRKLVAAHHLQQKHFHLGQE